jgi:hypothetical protein
MTDQKKPAPAWLAACYALAIFVGAFLVFQVQPVISKTILPWFGGSPAVWTTCMLFFQVVLFGGYVYAHLLSTKLTVVWQGAVHVGVIIAALALLPITPDSSWKPQDSANPTWRIIALLGANVGLPYFLLSTTGPLLQAWFGQRFPGRSPYRLYALSNVGSLLALLTYPIAFEPTMTTHAQAAAWSVGFCAFAVICGYLAARWLGTDRGVGGQACGELSRAASGVREENTTSAEDVAPTWGCRAIWLLLPAFASVMLLATTNHVCQDVAVIPFLWVAPLSLYLLSFIICFDSPRWYVRRGYGVLTALSVLGACGLVFWNVTDHLLLEITVYFAALFGLCMLCHGELVRRRPAPRYLTEFYLLCSAGGALGGILVALICPIVFSTFVEMHVGLLGAYLLAIGVIVADASAARPGVWRLRPAQLGLVIVLFGLLAVVKVQINQVVPSRLAAMRNFYGVLYVDEVASDDPDQRGRVMFHGRVAHGYQFAAEHRRRTPTMYFDPTSGIGVTFARFPRAGQAPESPLRVGIIGLGAGTLAAYGEPGDYYRFYEINPHVITLADHYFTFVKDSPAKIDIVLGDARLSMEREPDQNFDVLVLDAFSGDAIPAHLLTKEAFDIYRRHLTPDGVIAAHISNRHVDLAPVLANVAGQFPLASLQILTQTDPDRAATSSHWVLLSNNRRFLDDEVVRSAAGELGRYAHVPLWTDQYSNLLQLLK